jgi:hypothetical protein
VIDNLDKNDNSQQEATLELHNIIAYEIDYCEMYVFMPCNFSTFIMYAMHKIFSNFMVNMEGGPYDY